MDHAPLSTGTAHALLWAAVFAILSSIIIIIIMDHAPLSTGTAHALLWAAVFAILGSRFLYRTPSGPQGDDARHAIGQALTGMAALSHRPPSVEEQITAAIKADDVELLAELLSPRRLGVVVTDDFLHNVLLDQIAHGNVLLEPTRRVSMNRQVCRLLCKSMSKTLIADYQRGGSRDSPLFGAVLTGQVEVVKFLVNNFPHIFDIHQFHGGLPLLHYAASGPGDYSMEVRRELCRFLVDEKGLDPNEDSSDGWTPFLFVLCDGYDPKAALVLLECGGDPCRIIRQDWSTIDITIQYGYAISVSLLLSHGAVLSVNSSIALYKLLCSADKPREAKLNVCYILMGHTARTTLQSCLERAIDNGDRASCAILFEAGMKTGVAMDYAVNHENKPICAWLVFDYRVNPFVVQDERQDQEAAAALSPFHASAQKENVAVFEYFLGLWNARSFHGHQGEDDVLDIFCRDQHVSFQAIELLVQQQSSRAAQKNAHGFFPFQVAVESGARLDVIFHLLKHSPDALEEARR